MDSIRECSVLACSSAVDARGLCSSHYARLKRYGDPLGRPVKVVNTCGVDACDRPSVSWGYCGMHSQRYYHHGDPLASFKRRRSNCRVDDCPELTKGHGYCAKHLRRLKSNGDPAIARSGGRPTLDEHPRWAAIHKRVQRAKGAAVEHQCVDCGGRADEWSYDNADPDELRDRRLNIAYSLSIDHYEPRCIKCHRAFDAAHRRNRKNNNQFRPTAIDTIAHERL